MEVRVAGRPVGDSREGMSDQYVLKKKKMAINMNQSNRTGENILTKISINWDIFIKIY